MTINPFVNGQILTAEQLNSAFDHPLLKEKNLSDLLDKAAARNALELGPLATKASLGIYNVMDFGADNTGTTSTHVAINAAINAANAAGGGIVLLPAGTYLIIMTQGRISVKSNIVLAGQGMGITTILVNDLAGGTDAITNGTGGNIFPPMDNLTLQDFTIKGMADTNPTAGGQLIRVSGTNILIERVESRYSRSFGMVVLLSDNVVIRECQIFRSVADGIAVWGSPNAQITNNQIVQSNDDAISVHCADTDQAPVRSGLIIANNNITESQGISAGGAKIVSISGNVMRRMMTYGINIWGAGNTQGNSMLTAVSILGNIITDVFRRQEPNPRNSENWYIKFNGGPWQAGSLNSVPGEPAAGTGVVAPLYGTDASATFYANGTNLPQTPTPGSFFVDIRDNICMRTLPAVSNVSDWGFPSSANGLWVGSNGDGSGYYDGPISEASLNTTGLRTVGPMRKSRISKNTFNTTAASALYFNVPGSPHDYDDLEIEGNIIRDFYQYGIQMNTSAAQFVKIVDNDFNGDPRFLGAGRGPNGTWIAGGGALPVGIFAPAVQGVSIIRNRFRNLAQADVVGAGVHFYDANLVIGQPAVTGFSTLNKGLGTFPPIDRGWQFLVQDSDPTSASFGTTLFAPPTSSGTMPATGTWVRGAYVSNINIPTNTPPNGQVTKGWIRVSTGSSNNLYLDWMPDVETIITPSVQGIDSGDNVVVNNWANLVIITTNGGAIATATITLPDPTTVPTFSRISIVPSGTITTLSVVSAGAGTVVGAPTTMAPGKPFAFTLNTNSWVASQ